MTFKTPSIPLAFAALAFSSQLFAGAFLPAIPKGTIAVQLNTVATGMAAPDYAISPPGDASRLFVVEQNGLLRIIQNGTLLSDSALNIQSRVQIAPVGNGPLNPGNANDE